MPDHTHTHLYVEIYVQGLKALSIQSTGAVWDWCAGVCKVCSMIGRQEANMMYIV